MLCSVPESCFSSGLSVLIQCAWFVSMLHDFLWSQLLLDCQLAIFGGILGGNHAEACHPQHLFSYMADILMRCFHSKHYVTTKGSSNNVKHPTKNFDATSGHCVCESSICCLPYLAKDVSHLFNVLGLIYHWTDSYKMLKMLCHVVYQLLDARLLDITCR